MLRRSDALAEQSAELKQIADAARPLYNSLDDRQRQRFVQFVSNYMVANEAEDWRERLDDAAVESSRPERATHLACVGERFYCAR